MGNYFKGWYFKQQAGDNAVAFITALHNDENGKSTSLQIVTDDSANFIPFPTEAVKLHSTKPYVSIGTSLFSPKGIHLDVCNSDFNIKGDLQFKSLCKPRYDIMGPFKYVPYMECRHSVFSLNHNVQGSIIINGKTIDFNRGVGYIEGDRGHSFPKQYLWTQCCFDKNSLMLSVAEIPYLGLCFTGIIAIILYNGREYRLSSYLGAKPELIGNGEVIIKQGKYVLSAKLICGDYKSLYAPIHGAMSRNIRESIKCRVQYRFYKDNSEIFSFISDSASFENEYY